MYKVRTVSGSTHQYIESWKKWSIDEDFIEFNQQGDLLIIPKNQILKIYT